MSDEILVNVTPQETRVALVERGVLQELYLERARDRGVAGNVYKGRVVRVLPGMQAAFVDIGLEKAAFLFAGDVQRERREEGVPEWRQEVIGDSDVGGEARPGHPPIEDLVRQGDQIMVQVSKEPLGSKGARVTAQITLPGRYLVYMPGLDHVGVSRRIEEEGERGRLAGLVGAMRAEGDGYIVRTVSEGVGEDELSSDMAFLKKLWLDVAERREHVGAPALLYSDLDLPLRAMRDLVTDGIDKIRVDCPQTHDRLRAFIQAFMPQYEGCLEFYTGSRSVFDLYGVDEEINRALRRKVELKSGGSIVIDHTEALTAIDVNSGSYVGASNLEETILKINLEAAREIARQLRLRNIGGLIVVDFIDMLPEANREILFDSFSDWLSSDRSKINLLEISALGLVEMTRKRSRESLQRFLCEPCSYCGGQGVVKTRETVCCEIFRETLREARDFPGTSRKLMILASVDVVDLLLSEENESVAWLSSHLGKDLEIRADPGYHREKYEIFLF